MEKLDGVILDIVFLREEWELEFMLNDGYVCLWVGISCEYVCVRRVWKFLIWLSWGRYLKEVWWWFSLEVIDGSGECRELVGCGVYVLRVWGGCDCVLMRVFMIYEVDVI